MFKFGLSKIININVVNLLLLTWASGNENKALSTVTNSCVMLLCGYCISRPCLQHLYKDKTRNLKYSTQAMGILNCNLCTKFQNLPKMILHLKSRYWVILRILRYSCQAVTKRQNSGKTGFQMHPNRFTVRITLKIQFIKYKNFEVRIEIVIWKTSVSSFLYFLSQKV